MEGRIIQKSTSLDAVFKRFRVDLYIHFHEATFICRERYTNVRGKTALDRRNGNAYNIYVDIPFWRYT